MAITRKDYTEEAVKAARSVLLELIHLLGEYHEDIVVIGGWVPELLMPGDHTGSMDIDLALNHKTLQDAGYRTIQKLLRDRGYREHDEQPFIFFRDIHVEGNPVTVQVDLLAGEYEGASRSHRHQRIQDVLARKVRGCDLAFDMCEEVSIDGLLPDGARDAGTVRVAGIVPFLVMKGMALHDRLKEKDAWDVYYCMRQHPGGLDALVNAFAPHIGHGLVREGLAKIAAKFQSPEHIGPKQVADFDELTDKESIEIRRRDAFERVHAFLERLGII
jgi:hypothetical protein